MAKSKVKIIKSPNQAIRDLEKIAKSLKGPNSVMVGLPSGSNAYPDGTPVIEVAAIHEFGSPVRGIPQRSFLRATVQTKRRKYKRLFRRLSKKIIEGRINKKQALSLMGLKVQGDIQETISRGILPRLKSRVGTPLIDTGHLRQSITFEVKD